MSAIRESSASSLQPAQATELSLLLDLEARWENVKRTTPSQGLRGGHGTDDLLGRQKAYEAFRSKLVAYNNRYKPPHVPELLLNTPARLSKWCQKVRNVYLQVEGDPRVLYPADLLEKAYQRADQMAARMNKVCVSRLVSPGTVRSVIGDLEALSKWCDELGRTSSMNPGAV